MQGASLMRDQYFDTLCNTGDGVYIVDAKMQIIRWNKGAEKILKYSETEVLNRECYRVIGGKNSQENSCCFQNCRIHASVLKGMPQRNFDLLTHTREKEPLWVNISILSPPEGMEPFIVHIVRDITREKNMQLALEQFLADLGSTSLNANASGEKQVPKNSPSQRPHLLDKTLSSREIEVLTLLAEGLPTKGLAQRLNISHFTARNHIQNILVKLELHSKAQAVSYAFKRGIL
jgi:PAS domain S-box-containing protein